jgi:transposase-like protein
MVERGISVDHATVHRWVIRYSPELLGRFDRRKRPVGRKWHVDETLYLIGVAGHSHSMRSG